MVTAVSRFLSVAALAVVLYAVPAAAQTGRISGMVRDAGGVALSGATVAVRNQATGASKRTTSTADGRFTVSDLAPGGYTVSASMPGVRALRKDVQVTAGATRSLPPLLGTGAPRAGPPERALPRAGDPARAPSLRPPPPPQARPSPPPHSPPAPPHP